MTAEGHAHAGRVFGAGTPVARRALGRSQTRMLQRLQGRLGNVRQKLRLGPYFSDLRGRPARMALLSCACDAPLGEVAALTAKHRVRTVALNEPCPT
jgi:hypothetical protein